ncbi:MAG: hypothetical protein NT015_13725 [Alphaproteobacteria bacterium]|nr:hypothetical protein [Alphaproteobacteria bacterium]
MRGFLVFVLALAAVGCTPAQRQPQWCSAEMVRRDAEAVLAGVTRATIAEDIEAYMSYVPETSVIDDTSGEVIDRDRLREYVLRDWGVITETKSLEQGVESVTMNGCESAELIVNQRWERVMTRPNGAEGTDLILTTQRHRETWRHTEQGWRGFEVEELGGDIFVNGERYAPE